MDEEFAAPERMIRKRRPKKRYAWIKSILLIILFTSALVLIALSPLFNITEISVEGNIHDSSDGIIAVTGIVPDVNGFKTIGLSFVDIVNFRFGKAEENILGSFPYIRRAVAKFKIPSKVHINIEERKPLGLIPYLGANLLMDSEGYIMDTVEAIDGLPLIKGLKFESYKLGQALGTDNPKSIEAVVKIIREINSLDKQDDFKLMELLKTIDVADNKSIYLLIDDRIIVNIGDTEDLNYRLTFLKQILLKKSKKDDRGVLDFTTGSKPILKPLKEGE